MVLNKPVGISSQIDRKQQQGNKNDVFSEKENAELDDASENLMEIEAINKLIWLEEAEELDRYLSLPGKSALINNTDLHGYPPIHLAIMLGRNQCVEVLLKHNAMVRTHSRLGWTAIHEATSLGNREILRCVLEKRNKEWSDFIIQRQPQIVKQLKEIDDFSIQIKWNFTSWLPILTQYCPSDVYTIYKQGANVRLDMTLVGFDQLKWQYGKVSYLYLNESDDGGHLYLLDHDKKTFSILSEIERQPMVENEINVAMNSPLNMSWIEEGEISFSPVKTGIFGFGTHKSDMIGNYQATVYSVNNLQVVTCSRDEHLLGRPSNPPLAAVQSDKNTPSTSGNILLDAIVLRTILASQVDIIVNDLINRFSLDKGTEADEKRQQRERILQQKIRDLIETEKLALTFPCPSLSSPDSESMSLEDYFFPERNEDSVSILEGSAMPTSTLLKAQESSLSRSFLERPKTTYLSDPLTIDCNKYHQGRRMHATETSKNYRATLWMSDDFPIKIRELLPLVEVMASNNMYMKKLKHFIELELPSGFPVKLDIAISKMLNVQVTFSDGHKLSDDERTTMQAEGFFKIPENYKLSE